METPPAESSAPQPAGERALALRIRQQEILAELGVTALRGTPFPELLQETVRLAAEGLKPNSAKCWNTFPLKSACCSAPASVGTLV